MMCVRASRGPAKIAVVGKGSDITSWGLWSQADINVILPCPFRFFGSAHRHGPLETQRKNWPAWQKYSGWSHLERLVGNASSTPPSRTIDVRAGALIHDCRLYKVNFFPPAPSSNSPSYSNRAFNTTLIQSQFTPFEALSLST